MGEQTCCTIAKVRIVGFAASSALLSFLLIALLIGRALDSAPNIAITPTKAPNALRARDPRSVGGASF